MKFIKDGDWYEVLDGNDCLGYMEKSTSRLTKKNGWKIFNAAGVQIKEQIGLAEEQRSYRTRKEAAEALQEYNKTRAGGDRQ